jgi:hypothetical protein
MAETLFDFSKSISDQEFPTEIKIKDIVDSIHIENILVKQFNNTYIQEYILLFPKKDSFFFTVTLFGGGSSGIKTSFNSDIATGGYSSGTIVRFPIEIKNTSGNIFAQVWIGKGGNSFEITDKILINNGEYSNFDLVTSKETSQNPYQTEKGRNNVNLLEGLSSYGSGKLLDGSIIEECSTGNYFSFRGSNSFNTNIKGTTKINNQIPVALEDRNNYAPYTSEYNGYNSFLGVGGNYLGDIHGEENTGAGGAGVYNGSSKYVGKGGNGGCMIEYEASDPLEVYAVGYLFVENNSKIIFIIYDAQGNKSREIEITLEGGIYSIPYLLEVIKYNLNDESITTIILNDNSYLKIKMTNEFTIDSEKSSGDLLIDLGILNSDLITNDKSQIKSKRNEDGTYEFLFSKQITSICSLNKFSTQKIF